MNNLDHFIIITGNLTSGKTTLCRSLYSKLKKFWFIDGVLSYTNNRNFTSKEKSCSYDILHLASNKKLSWAQRNKPNGQFTFNEDNAQIITQKILDLHQATTQDIIIVDNLGFHEMKEKGFHSLITSSNLQNTQKIISVQKDMLNEFLNYYNFKNPTIIDLDKLSQDEAIKQIIKIIRLKDRELIGTFASMTTIMEVGLGTTLNALGVPLKGAFLAGLQNFMLILFGKKLKVRGLLSIVTITAGLKSFSIAGNRFRPMFYIFCQGLCFIIPVWCFGLNLITILIGSILLGLSTFFLGILLNSIIYGTSYINSHINAFKSILAYFNITDINAWDIVIIILSIKIIISICVAFSAYFLKFDRFFNKLENKIQNITPKKIDHLQQDSWKNSFRGSIKDILNLKFITSFIFLSLVIYFFAKLNTNDYILVIVRAIIISWFGFVLSRRIDFLSILNFFKRKELHNLAYALEKSLGIIASLRGPKSQK